MHELKSTEFYKVRTLFEPLMSYQMFCAGVLDGLYQGRVFVDDTANPQSGFVTKDGIWWFLAGNPHNEIFNKALNTAIFDRTINGEKGWGGMLVCHPADWDAQIPTIYAPRIPIKTGRLHYICQQLNVDWRAQIPDGFDIRFADQSLVDEGIEVPGTVASVLELRKDSTNPDQKAVGFVAVHDRKIVAYSVIDCIVNTGGDIGLYTDGAYRRRGLAFLTSAAVIEYALSHGVTIVHWDCEAFNHGSIHTAEKLGLQLSHKHTMYNLILNPVLHDVNRAWSHFDAGRYPQAIEICQVQIGGDKPAHPHFHYVLARCQMEYGQAEQAVQALQGAALAGWDSPDEAKGDFPVLTTHPAWNSILEQMEKNAQKEAG